LRFLPQLSSAPPSQHSLRRPPGSAMFIIERSITLFLTTTMTVVRRPVALLAVMPVCRLINPADHHTARDESLCRVAVTMINKMLG
jgi:hypothetical protein